MSRLTPGDSIKERLLTSVLGPEVQLPHPQLLTHIQFRRFAGCPICNLHLASFNQRKAELAERKLQELVVFHSSPQALQAYQVESPYLFIADPTKKLYREFGVEQSLLAVLYPQAMFAALKGLFRRGMGWIDSSPLGLPADFLLAPDGTILACHYGRHADDQWSVDELLALIDQHSYSNSKPSTPVRSSIPSHSSTESFHQGVVSHD